MYIHMQLHLETSCNYTITCLMLTLVLNSCACVITLEEVLCLTVQPEVLAVFKFGGGPSQRIYVIINFGRAFIRERCRPLV